MSNLLEERPCCLVLGAGASRAVSYVNTGSIPSPLDYDFFDMLQRVECKDKEDDKAVRRILALLPQVPHANQNSMERAFYTMHLRAYLDEKLANAKSSEKSQNVIRDFARAIQTILRAAHGKRTCTYHSQIIESLTGKDLILSSNYDLVAERALRQAAESRMVNFGEWIYGIGEQPKDPLIPNLVKLHGSSNWKVETENSLTVRTKAWSDFDGAPGYRGHAGKGSFFPIFLPFWDKRIEHEPWLEIWQFAFKNLQACNSLIVWGYSLPVTDVKAREFFYLALKHSVLLPLSSRRIRLCVIDPSAETRQRWRELYPQAQYWQYADIKDFFSQPPNWFKIQGS
jgi:hypothetical protein